MAYLKKLIGLAVLLAFCAYASLKWDEHAAFEKAGDRLARQMGDKIVTFLGDTGESCRGYAVLDSVAVESSWPLAKSGTALLYISGRNGSAMSLRYTLESTDSKVYIQPEDPKVAQSKILQFGLSGCS